MKTPKYTRDAIKEYENKVTKKQVVFNPEKDDEKKLLKAVDSDSVKFSVRVKELLTDFYKLK